MQVHTLAILGVGLIGGSVALAARARGLAHRVIGFEPDEKSQSRSLALGLVDEMAPAANSGRIAEADLVICCAPVDRVAGLFGLDRDDVAPSGEVVALPWFDGERTPDLPNAAGTIAGMRHDTQPQQVLMAAYEGAIPVEMPEPRLHTARG